MNKSKLLVIGAFAMLLLAFFAFDLGQYFTLEFARSRLAAFDQFYAENRALTLAAYFAIYVLVTGLSLPGATIMTLLAGALFGLLTGVILVSFASTAGATIAFLVARFVLRDAVQNRFAGSFESINAGIDRDGPFYLFTLRLVPLFPFFAINLAMGLTSIKTWVFAVVSQLGMLAGTIVYVNAGTQLAEIESLSGIASPRLILAFALLGIFPLIARKFIDWVKARKVYSGWPRPKQFDHNVVVIGAGSGGLVSALIAATVNAKVTLIERNKMGGDCLNYGCVPSKALIRSAKFMSHIQRSKDFGIADASANLEFSDVMDRVHKVIATIEPHDSVERFEGLGVNCIMGEARITSPFSVEVNGETLTTANIIIATGSAPWAPPIPGLDQIEYLTSDNVWELRALPKRLVVLGGGPIGCELAQSFSRLGSEVTLVEMQDRLLTREDPEVSEMVAQRFQADGVRLLLGHTADTFSDGSVKCVGPDGQSVEVQFDHVLVALGRKAATDGLGLDELQIDVNKNGTIPHDPYLRTRYPNIYVCGDVAGPYQFTHTASHQAWYATVNALFGQFRKFRVDYSVVPWATYTEPEVARVGLNETQAKNEGVAHEVTVYGIDDLDRAIADSEAHGMVKVITRAGKDEILGATIVGEHAADLLAEFVLAMKHGLGLKKIMGTIHTYPTLAEANKFAAGQWQKAHKPEKLLDWVGRYHQWKRG